MYRPLLLLLLLCAGPTLAQPLNPAEHEAIAYSSSTPTDSIARLQEQLDAGSVNLVFDEDRGFLASVLNELDIPVSSQGLVFSRTSLQVDRIAPWAPRAIYFNDDVYVAWVQGGPVIEIASVDPNLGAVFYTLPQDASRPPKFQRETGTCLMCHDSSSITGGVPGFVVRSVLPDRYGYTIATISDRPTTDRTAFSERWGGWYVTGTHGEHTHAGNAMSPLLMHEIGNVTHYAAKFDLTTDGNVADLSERFDTDPYLSSHSVDGAETEHLPTTVRRIERATEPLVRGLLFVKETPLVSPIQGTTDFAEEFARRGPRDRQGRSLRDLDLEKRLFRYPLSFLVYSESFAALPEIVKKYVHRRLREVLGGKDESEAFAHLSEQDRGAITAILKDTAPQAFTEGKPKQSPNRE